MITVKIVRSFCFLFPWKGIKYFFVVKTCHQFKSKFKKFYYRFEKKNPNSFEEFKNVFLLIMVHI